MEFDLDLAVSVLSRTPATLDAFLRDQPEEWTHRNEGPDTWSPFDVVGHLIQGERADWIPRARILLEHGESRPFTPFDRVAMFQASRGKTINQLLDDLAEARAASLRDLAELKLKPADLELVGRHPALGTVTLRHLLATWVVHDLGHIRQITRTMAKQWREEIGPWKAFVPVVTE